MLLNKSVSPVVLSLIILFSAVPSSSGQTQPPNLFSVVPYSAVRQGAVASVTSYHGDPCALDASTLPPCGAQLNDPNNFESLNSIVNLSSALNASIATALAVIPLASPASGVITKTDVSTGAELPVSSTLGPIFTERAETIGKHRFYIGISNQDFHFTRLNGQSIKALRVLDPGGVQSNIQFNGQFVSTFPTTIDVGMNVRLAQNVAFLTYGVTNRFDVSVALPIVHASISSNAANGLIYVGDGFGGNGVGNCWCVDTFTPASAPVNGSGLILSQINFAQGAKTGFGDMLLRFKGNVLERHTVALAVGTDVRVPTGDEKNFLGTGAVAVKPFAALSLYSKPFSNGLVFSPHFNVGWQFAGKSLLGGGITGASPVTLANGAVGFGPPFTTTKDYLPDIFSWAVGTEIAFGRHNTVVADILGNQIGWVHGIQNMTNASVANVPFPQTTTQQAPLVTATGLVSAGRVSFGEYSGAFGYKARIAGSLVATFNILIRFDNNGLTDRFVPLYGLSYTF